jgi:hypothetical protein
MDRMRDAENRSSRVLFLYPILFILFILSSLGTQYCCEVCL